MNTEHIYINREIENISITGSTEDRYLEILTRKQWLPGKWKRAGIAITATQAVTLAGQLLDPPEKETRRRCKHDNKVFPAGWQIQRFRGGARFGVFERGEGPVFDYIFISGAKAKVIAGLCLLFAGAKLAGVISEVVPATSERRIHTTDK